ncbi:hypothetical protein [Streptococcus pluranimalium]|uniref:hypothetical protein n=1 Tax=Streptococcus pluranimalium TaxID=82348 RepID=UPI0039FC3C27
MKKNSLIVGLVIIFISLIIGGVLMFNSQEKQREQNYRREQDRIVKYFVENYELSDGDTIKKYRIYGV